MVAAVVIATAAPARAGDCGIRNPDLTIETPEGATLPSDGHVLVAQDSHLPTMIAGPLDKWRLVDRGRRVAPTLRHLAPGLTAIVGAGDRLENHVRGGKLRAFTRSKTPGPTLTAPSAKQVTHVHTASRRRSRMTVDVELARPATAAQFLVMLDKDGKVARSFGRTVVGSTRVVVYLAGECMMQPDGTLSTKAGDEVTLAWVDPFGRMSPRSPVYKVGSRRDMDADM